MPLHTDPAAGRSSHDWRSITALNLVSALAQVGQFGIPFIVLPLWLAQRGASTFELSLFASCLWFGQLPGLGWAPRLCERFGARWVVIASLLCTVLALGSLTTGLAALWLPAAVLAGFGQGLRWIGLEPWLYSIAPSHAQGRLIGFHETLIALAPVVAPGMAAWFDIGGIAPLLLGIGFVCVSALPLAWAREPDPSRTHYAELAPERMSLRRLWREASFATGICIAFFGGMSEAAFAGLFPVYGEAHGLDSQHMAGLLLAFGCGGLLLQYPAGWLADHLGMRFTGLCCGAAAVAVAAVLTLPLAGWALQVAVLLLGGLVTAYLTLALIAAAHGPAADMARRMSLVSMTYTLTAVAGPLLAGGVVQQVGGNGLMWTLVAFALALTLALAHRRFSLAARSA